MWAKIVVLVIQFLVEMAKMIPRAKPAAPKPSEVPPTDEVGRSLDRARKRTRRPGP